MKKCENEKFNSTFISIQLSEMNGSLRINLEFLQDAFSGIIFSFLCYQLILDYRVCS